MTDDDVEWQFQTILLKCYCNIGCSANILLLDTHDCTVLPVRTCTGSYVATCPYYGSRSPKDHEE